MKEFPPARRYLLPLGSLEWVDFTGQTPFIRAAQAGDVPVMQLLLSKGADPKIATFNGTTALMAAAGVNWVIGETFSESPAMWTQAVQLCLDQGIDVNAVNAMGLQAVHGAANRGSDDIIELLAQHGARARSARQGRAHAVRVGAGRVPRHELTGREAVDDGVARSADERRCVGVEDAERMTRTRRSLAARDLPASPSLRHP